jgi:hypothetical protein
MSPTYEPAERRADVLHRIVEQHLDALVDRAEVSCRSLPRRVTRKIEIIGTRGSTVPYFLPIFGKRATDARGELVLNTDSDRFSLALVTLCLVVPGAASAIDNGSFDDLEGWTVESLGFIGEPGTATTDNGALVLLEGNALLTRV